MKFTFFIGLLFVALAVEGQSYDLPRSFKTCKRGIPNYSKCVAKAAEDAVISLASGLKSFKILPIEPLAVNRVMIPESAGSVSLKQTYRNIKLHGLTKGFKASDYDIDFNKLIVRFNSYNPQVDFVGDYVIDGKIMILPIKGQGFSNITLLGLKSQNTIYCEKFNKNGEMFLRVKKYDIKFTPENVLLRFDNLLKGNDGIGKQMNTFLNQNSNLLFNQLQGSYEKTFGIIFANLANNIFSRIAVNKLFPQ